MTGLAFKCEIDNAVNVGAMRFASGVYVRIGLRAVPVESLTVDADGAIIITLQREALEARITAINGDMSDGNFDFNNSDGLNKELI